MIGRNLGSDVQDRVDAYKENPQALQARYAQSQKLLDLLAMQKMKSEKDAYARDMKMKMEKKDATIVQQYEAELAGRTKNDILEGVGGVLKDKQNKAQSNINKVAARGVATQPANNMLSLAGGGIVGFAAGDQVPTSLSKLVEEKKAELERSYRAGDIDYAEYSKALEKLDAPDVMGPDSIARDVLGKDGVISSLVADQEYDDQFMVGGTDAGEKVNLTPGPYTTALTNKLQSKSPIGELMKRNIKDRADEIGGPNIALKGSPALPIADQFEDEPYEKEVKPGIAGLGGNQVGAAKMDPSLVKFGSNEISYDAPNRDSDMKNKVKAGIESLIDTDRDDLRSYLDVDPKQQAEIDRFAAERKGITANLLDPERLRKDRLSAGLLAPGGATLGESFGNIGRGIMAAQSAQDKTTVSEFDANKAIFDKELARSQGIKKEAVLEEGKRVTKGIQAGTLFSNQEDQNLTADAKGILNADISNARSQDARDLRKMTYGLALVKEENRVNIANQLATNTAEANRLRAELNKITKESMNVSKLQTILGSVNKEVARSAKAATESFKVELEMATIAAQSIKDKNSLEYKAAVQTLNDVKGRQKSLYELMVRDLLSQRSDILKRLGGTGGGGSKNLSAADKIAGVVK
tara:strand:- start:1067 stop:2977 length:1911 start_codon:yes stop_codon:yes gene_type:complete